MDRSPRSTHECNSFYDSFLHPSSITTYNLYDKLQPLHQHGCSNSIHYLQRSYYDCMLYSLCICYTHDEKVLMYYLTPIDVLSCKEICLVDNKGNDSNVHLQRPFYIYRT
jgi:hypothetical protein